MLRFKDKLVVVNGFGSQTIYSNGNDYSEHFTSSYCFLQKGVNCYFLTE